MKNKKVIIGIIIVILIAIITISVIFILNKQNENKAKQTLLDFITAINEKDYEKMYEKVASMNMSKDDFIKRNKNIYEGIESNNIKIEIKEIEKQDKDYKIKYNEKMYTGAGEVQFDNTVAISKEDNQYKLKWASNFIFPQLNENEKVRISTIKSKRGDIIDREGKILATDRTNSICWSCATEKLDKIKIK